MSNMTWFHANNKSKTTQRVMLIPCREMLYRVTIPTNKNITIEAWGADGGDIISTPGGTIIENGGRGGYVCVHISNYNTTTTLPLSINAGGSGDDVILSNMNDIFGGYHGGGDGYMITSNGTFGAGGGGCTEIILTNEDVSIIIVGGGGGAANNARAGLTYYGGNGGGVNGQDGQQRPYDSSYGTTYNYPSGWGGSNTSGGYRGGYGDSYGSGTTSQDGSSKTGGKGNTYRYAGGGGGAGYYGGGGGGNAQTTGAGGGGSSWSSITGAINASYGTEDYVEKPTQFGKNGGVRITYYI